MLSAVPYGKAFLIQMHLGAQLSYNSRIMKQCVVVVGAEPDLSRCFVRCGTDVYLLRCIFEAMCVMLPSTLSSSVKSDAFQFIHTLSTEVHYNGRAMASYLLYSLSHMMEHMPSKLSPCSAGE